MFLLAGLQLARAGRTGLALPAAYQALAVAVRQHLSLGPCLQVPRLEVSDLLAKQNRQHRGKGLEDVMARVLTGQDTSDISDEAWDDLLSCPISQVRQLHMQSQVPLRSKSTSQTCAWLAGAAKMPLAADALSQVRS